MERIDSHSTAAFAPYPAIVRSEMARLVCFYGKGKECHVENPTAHPCDSCSRVDEILSIFMTGKGTRK